MSDIQQDMGDRKGIAEQARKLKMDILSEVTRLQADPNAKHGDAIREYQGQMWALDKIGYYQVVLARRSKQKTMDELA